MADCLKSNLSVQEPVYCKDNSGNILPDTAMYSWMAVRAKGPNVLYDNRFCGSNRFSSDVQIDGDLNVNGEINFPPPNQAQIPCNELAVTINVTPPPNNQLSDWQPIGFTDQITTIVVMDINQANVVLSGIVPLGQCYINLLNNTENTITLLDEDSTSNASQPQNRFRINAANVLPIQRNEAVNIYYSPTAERWFLLAHL